MTIRRTRLHRRPPVLDLVVAAALMIFTGVAQAIDHTLPQPWITVLAVIWVGSVVLRTVAPLAMAAIASAGAATYALFPVHTESLAVFVALLVIMFSVGANLAGRRLWIATAMLLTSAYVLQILAASRPGGDSGFGDVYLAPLVLVLGPGTAGLLLRRARRQSAELHRLGAELTAEREVHARAAAAEERNRIARELHDVISHSVSVMVVQAGAAESQLAPDSPAREQLHAVRQTGRETLTELRRQLGVLRDGTSESPAPMPMPTLADLPGLAGSAVRLHYDAADVGPLPAGLGLTAYRVVQESLTNARRHAVGAPVYVTIGRTGDGLEVDVVNGPGPELLEPTSAGPDLTGPRAPGTPGGALDPSHGLTGMRERVALYAGRLEAGPTADGGWRVLVRLPIPSAAGR